MWVVLQHDPRNTPNRLQCWYNIAGQIKGGDAYVLTSLFILRFTFFTHYITKEIIDMKIIGICKSDFHAKNGEVIKGYFAYVVDNIDPRYGQGQSAERIYLSERKLATMNMPDPFVLLDREVKILYNRYGKVETIDILD